MAIATHHDAEKYPWLFWSFWLMTALLVGTLTFALLHTLAWLVRLWLSRDEWRAHKALARTGKKKVYRRFHRFNRVLHLLMLLSFFTLALSFGSSKQAGQFSLITGSWALFANEVIRLSRQYIIGRITARSPASIL